MSCLPWYFLFDDLLQRHLEVDMLNLSDCFFSQNWTVSKIKHEHRNTKLPGDMSSVVHCCFSFENVKFVAKLIVIFLEISMFYWITSTSVNIKPQLQFYHLMPSHVTNVFPPWRTTKTGILRLKLLSYKFSCFAFYLSLRSQAGLKQTSEQQLSVSCADWRKNSRCGIMF